MPVPKIKQNVDFEDIIAFRTIVKKQMKFHITKVFGIYSLEIENIPVF